jgi:TonB family protein
MMLYFIQVSLCLVIFNLAYEAFFRRDTFFIRNRIYLVGSLILTVLLPLLPIPELIPLFRSGAAPSVEVGMPVPATNFYSSISNKMSSLTSQQGFSIFRILFSIYLTGVVFMLVQMLMQFTKIRKIMSSSISYKQGYIRIFLCDEGLTSHFSFFRNIFINKSFIEGKDKEFEKVLSHEFVHVKQLHSLDLLLAEMICIIFWFNPFAWFYRKSLQEIHEFLADNEVLQSGCSRAEYQAVLVNQALGITVFSLSNNFNHIKLKKRIIMMSKMKSSNLVYWKTLIILPVIMLALSFSGSKVSSQVNSGKDVTYSGKVIDIKTNEALPGAHVVVKGTSVGTKTDELGMFKLTTSEPNTLVVSFVGYETYTYVPEKAETTIKMVRKVNKIEGTTVTPDSKKNELYPPPPPPPPPPPDTTKVKLYYQKANSNEPVFTSKTHELIYEAVEKPAEFQGSDLNIFREYVFKNVKYPEVAVKNKIEGKVILQFVVNSHGEVVDVKVIRGVDKSLDEAALAVVKSSPSWSPGMQNGKAVAEIFTMPITFNLTGENNKEEKNK